MFQIRTVITKDSNIRESDSGPLGLFTCYHRPLLQIKEKNEYDQR